MGTRIHRNTSLWAINDVSTTNDAIWAGERQKVIEKKKEW